MQEAEGVRPYSSWHFHLGYFEPAVGEALHVQEPEAEGEAGPT